MSLSATWLTDRKQEEGGITCTVPASQKPVILFFYHLFLRLGNWTDGRTDGQKENTRHDQIYINLRKSSSSWLWAVIIINSVISDFLKTLNTLLPHSRRRWVLSHFGVYSDINERKSFLLAELRRVWRVGWNQPLCTEPSSAPGRSWWTEAVENTIRTTVRVKPTHTHCRWLVTVEAR